MIMTPAGMAIAAITVMLWILWSDTIRSKRPIPILYALRVALYLIVAGLMTVNLVRHPAMFTGGARILAIVAAAVGVAGAVYFGKRLVRRT